MLAYHTRTERGRERFLYVKLEVVDAKKLFSGIKNYEGSKEFHMALNGSFDDYISKRLAVPCAVQICNSKKELELRLAKVGLYL